MAEQSSPFSLELSPRPGEFSILSNHRDFPDEREVAPPTADALTVRVGGLRLPVAPLELSAANLFLLSRASIVPVGLTIFRGRKVEPATAKVRGSTQGAQNAAQMGKTQYPSK